MHTELAANDLDTINIQTLNLLNLQLHPTVYRTGFHTEGVLSLLPVPPIKKEKNNLKFWNMDLSTLSLQNYSLNDSGGNRINFGFCNFNKQLIFRVGFSFKIHHLFEKPPDTSLRIKAWDITNTVKWATPNHGWFDTLHNKPKSVKRIPCKSLFICEFITAFEAVPYELYFCV